jgi:hypothetical protein
MPRVSYTFKTMHIKIPLTFFTKMEKTHKIHMNPKKTSKSQGYLYKNKTKLEAFILYFEMIPHNPILKYIIKNAIFSSIVL